MGSATQPAKSAMRTSARTLVLVGTAAVIGTVLVVGVLHVAHSPGAGVNMVKKSQSTMLYDIPNFVYQRTQMHFPQAEENWLNMAAQGKIGDDVKPEHVLNKLNGIISDALTHALTENYVARVKAKKDAMEENYDVYDVHKGKVIHKMYGNQVGGSMTLKPPCRDRCWRNNRRLLNRQCSRSVSSCPGLKAGDRFIAQIPGHGQELLPSRRMSRVDRRLQSKPPLKRSTLKARRARRLSCIGYWKKLGV